MTKNDIHMSTKTKSQLALFGGESAISTPHPHEIWPPAATPEELAELSDQRRRDISIKGKTGIIDEFEGNFLNFLENKVLYAITFNSGTSALLAAYFALGVDEGDEVIGPALTFHAALSPAFLLKANVSLVDVRADTRCIDPAKIEVAITEKTKVITVVHQWGHPANMDAILAIASKHSLKVIEDCSHAHGSRYKGRPCGTFGDAAIFSLQAAKMICAGEGGILVTNSAICNERATLLGHYRDRSRDEVQSPELQEYWVTGFGQKLRMSPFNAVVAKHSLRGYPTRKAGRHACLNYFRARLAEVFYLEAPYVAPDVDMGAWYGFKPLYKKDRLHGLDIDKLVTALKAEGMEIERASAPVLSTQPLYRQQHDLMFPRRNNKIPNLPANTPVALGLQEESLSLPTFTDWEREKAIIDQYIEAFLKIGENVNELTK